MSWFGKKVYSTYSGPVWVGGSAFWEPGMAVDGYVQLVDRLYIRLYDNYKTDVITYPKWAKRINETPK